VFQTSAWYEVDANKTLNVSKKYVDGIKQEQPIGMEEFPIKCHMSYWNQAKSTPIPKYGVLPRRLPSYRDELVVRCHEVPRILFKI
jgi:hypothetical protein